MSTSTSLRTYLDFAVDAAWQAGQLTLGHFQANVNVEWKADDSPVTMADRGAEELLRRLIEDRFPDHAIMGEEFGESDRDSSYCWILDPIDGTRSFVRGVPLYGVLIGLQFDGEMVVGVCHFPGFHEMVAAARGEGCYWNGRPARVSTEARLEQALLTYTDCAEFARQNLGGVWERLKAATHTQRGWVIATGIAWWRLAGP